MIKVVSRQCLSEEYDFWPTVCKLLDLCYRSVVCLSVTLVHCGQSAGWIKMKLGTKVGLGSGHTVLDGDPAPPPERGIAPNFRPMYVVAKRLVKARCHLVRRQAAAQATLCYMGTQLPQSGTAPPNIGPVCIVAKRSPISATVLSTCYNFIDENKTYLSD